MSDRRRVNGPEGSTLPPVYDDENVVATARSRQRNGIRAMCKYKRWKYVQMVNFTDMVL